MIISAGNLLHPSRWPQEKLDLTGKRVAIVGTGSTGVQLATELSKVTSHLTVFQRTPNMALPMRQVQYNPPTQALPREAYPDLFAHRKDSFSGFSFNFIPRTTFADSAEQRRHVYEKLWAKGDFQFWLATYCDMLFDRQANAEAYKFWRDNVRDRVHDARLKDMLAPMQQPHAFGCKRVSLETGYFEIFNQDNVTLVDISEAGTPIKSITGQGIRTRDREYVFDVIICATGYDAVTGGLTQIDIRGPTGEITYLGSGRFTFDASEHPEPRTFNRISLVLGGSSITPGYALLARIVLGGSSEIDADVRVRVVDANKSEGDILLKDALDEYERKSEGRLKITHILSHPGEEWEGRKGHVEAELIKEVLFEPGKGTGVFLCGPPGMVQKAASPALREWGFEEGEDVFGF